MNTNEEMKQSLDKLIEQQYQMQQASSVRRNQTNSMEIDQVENVDLLEFCRDLLDQNQESSKNLQYINHFMLAVAALERRSLLYQPIAGLPHSAKNVFDIAKHCPNSAVRARLLEKRNEDLRNAFIDFDEGKLLRIIATMDKNEIDTCQIQMMEDAPAVPLIVLAVMMNRSSLLKALLDKDANPAVRLFPNPEVKQSCNLLVAAIVGQMPQIVELLLETSLSHSERIGNSLSGGAVLSDIPWHLAVLSGNSELFNVLYRKGIDINEKNTMGFDIFQLLQPERNTQVYLHFENVCQEWVNKISKLMQTPGVDTLPLQNNLAVMNQLLQGGNPQHQQMLRFLTEEQRKQNREKGPSQVGKMQMWKSSSTANASAVNASAGEKRKRTPDDDVARPGNKSSKK